MTPDTGMTSDMGGDFDNDVVAQALASTVDEVYERSGKDSILVTHSQGGGPGWTAAKYTDHIAAIVAIEHHQIQKITRHSSKRKFQLLCILGIILIMVIL